MRVIHESEFKQCSDKPCRAWAEFEAELEKNAKRLLIAKAWMKVRRAKEQAFGPDLFSDPAWDILLDLYISANRDPPLCISDLYLTSPTPPTTILRWVSVLEKRGLIIRRLDLPNRRRKVISLTEAGRRSMNKALDLAMESDRRLGLGRLSVIEEI